jgi:hypothetical protein
VADHIVREGVAGRRFCVFRFSVRLNVPFKMQYGIGPDAGGRFDLKLNSLNAAVKTFILMSYEHRV